MSEQKYFTKGIYCKFCYVGIGYINENDELFLEIMCNGCFGLEIRRQDNLVRMKQLERNKTDFKKLT